MRKYANKSHTQFKFVNFITLLTINFVSLFQHFKNISNCDQFYDKKLYLDTNFLKTNLEINSFDSQNLNS